MPGGADSVKERAPQPPRFQWQLQSRRASPCALRAFPFKGTTPPPKFSRNPLARTPALYSFQLVRWSMLRRVTQIGAGIQCLRIKANFHE